MKNLILALTLILTWQISFSDERCSDQACPALPEAVGGISHDSEIQLRNIALPGTSRPVGENSERLLPNESFLFWGLDRVVSNPKEGKTIMVEREIIEIQKVAHDQHIESIKFRSGKHMIDEKFVEKLRDILIRLGGLDNLRLHFIGHTDNQRLSARARAIYKDNYGLGEFRAKQAADFFRKKLGLAEQTVSYEGKGPDEPLASNDTPEGMAKNRRVEIQVWYDKTLTHKIAEPKFIPAPPLVRTEICRQQAAMCRRIEQSGHEKRVVVENAVQPIYFGVTQSTITQYYITQLRSIINDLQGKEGVQLKFIGHTDSNVLGASGRALYKDNQGLSRHRAKAVMRQFPQALGLPDVQLTFEGRGSAEPIADNATVQGRALNRRVEIEVSYLVSDENYITVGEIMACPEGGLPKNIERLAGQENKPANPYSMTPWRVSLDGAPVLAAHSRHGADVQRCVDVALEQAQIQIQYDNLQNEPKLNVSAWPHLAVPGVEINFRGWNNYPYWIKRSEVIVYRYGFNDRREAVTSVELDDALEASWFVSEKSAADNNMQADLWYVLRVYDAQGRYDETQPKSLPMADHYPDSEPDSELREAALRTGYGKQSRVVKNIPVQGGTITVNGLDVPDNHTVWVMDQAIPLDEKNAFVAQQIIPIGLHTVEVAVLDAGGNGELFWRDLELPRNDWFYVGIADLTLGINNTSGSPALVTGDDTLYDKRNAYGRLAYYAKGKVKNKYTLTSSVDSREEPLGELFSNFSRKDPRSLLRRLDSEDYYPTFGDDSTLVEDAPTQGKFYAKIADEKSHALWGNFKLDLASNELITINRGLYGAHGRYQSTALTSFAEQRTRIDLFAADPGSVAAREAYRGTGGSLYYLQNRDITRGSEQIQVQVRDKDSDILLSSTTLIAGQDYDMDELQGIVLLTTTLPSTADDSALVQASSLSGHPVYLVINYEYVPGFTDPNLFASGGRAEHWLTDSIQIGVTASAQQQLSGDQTLVGVDLTLRNSERSWLKLLAARTKGPGVVEQRSIDGGFSFIGQPTATLNDKADAQRIEAAFDLRDAGFDTKLQGSFYLQKRNAGYSAPGQQVQRDTAEQGIKLNTPLGEATNAELRYNAKNEQAGRDRAALEADLTHQLSEQWELGVGLRADKRRDDSSVVTEDTGTRTDLALRVEYLSQENWGLHGFVQGTMNRDQSRRGNNRAGMGGDWQASKRLKLNADIADGNLGSGATIGGHYQMSDQTALYLNYGLDSDSAGSEYGATAYNGSRSTFVSGGRSRFSDHASVYTEQKYTRGNQPRGLTQSYGIDLSPDDKWNYGLSLETGKLQTANSGQVKRKALGLRLGYSHDKSRYASAIEYRNDDSAQEDRDSWLIRNSYHYQTSIDWRLLTRLDVAASKSSKGDRFKGDFIEAVVGYAYRPVNNDRWNNLFKYTYFYDLASPGQLSPAGSSINYQQRSHILALDANYDLTTRWTIGGKYAFRRAELRDRLGSTKWFRSDAHLIVARLDWHLVKRWDLLLESRMLDLVQAKDTRTGALVALYRHFGQHAKVGVGFNFSDFSDDLTALDYNSRGVFLNVIGKF